MCHQMLERPESCPERTKISPPCVPAKMYCEETARARIDLSCFMRCARAGVRCAGETGCSEPFVPMEAMAESLCGGAAEGMVSLAPECAFGVVPAWPGRVQWFERASGAMTELLGVQCAACGAIHRQPQPTTPRLLGRVLTYLSTPRRLARLAVMQGFAKRYTWRVYQRSCRWRVDV